MPHAVSASHVRAWLEADLLVGERCVRCTGCASEGGVAGASRAVVVVSSGHGRSVLCMGFAQVAVGSRPVGG